MIAIHEFGRNLFLSYEVNKLLISEDVALIKALLETSKQRSETNGSVETATILLVGSTAALTWFTCSKYQYDSYRLLATIAVSSCLYASGKQLCSIVIRRRLKSLLIGFGYALSEFRAKLRKLLEFALECEYLEKSNQSFSTTSCELRSTIGTHCRTVFHLIRQVVKDIAYSASQLTPDDENSLSSLPLETFDDLLNEGLLLPANHLKNLSQLIRLLSSELLRRLVNIFILHESKSIYLRDFNRLYSKLCRVLTKPKNDIEKISVKLDHLIQYYEALWASRDAPREVDCTINQSNDLVTVMNVVQIRMKSVLLNLQDLEEDNSVFEDEVIVLKIDESVKELDSLSSLLSKLRRNYAKDNQNTPIESPVHREEKEVQAVANYSDAETPDDIDYEIFEDESGSWVGAEKELDSSQDWEPNKRIGLAVSLNHELRQVLSVKAQEHREREAKALGVPLDNVPQAQVAPVGETVEPTVSELPVDRKAEREAERERAAKELLALRQVGQSTVFATQLAKVAVERSKDFGSRLQDEERFGDDEEMRATKKKMGAED
ncbi:hypothetical protein HDE_10634 [Halotydeus destructor]|nr:hypothetical protein HDE_10634 [Halotydeus destructor]